jgi:hypothetical protein
MRHSASKPSSDVPRATCAVLHRESPPAPRLSGLERSQNPQFHRLKRCHSPIVGGPIQDAVKIE